MKTAAIISEYNPFHKGHEYQIRKTREETGATHILALMSGNFVQRGNPALVDKYRRAEMALLGGADLVLELPVPFALSSAEFFAEGAVRILDALHGVDLLSFGSEAGDLAPLQKIAHILSAEPPVYQAHLQEALAKGLSYPVARSEALLAYDASLDPAMAKSPNNILGIEYLKALIRLGSPITPYTLRRQGKGYHDQTLQEEQFASATALRKGILDDASWHGFIPSAVANTLGDLKTAGYPFVTEEDFRPLLLYRLLLEGHDLARLPDAQEGLDQRILSKLSHLREETLAEFLQEIKTKRYTHTRISRILFQFLLGLDQADLARLRRTTPPSVKILACNERGREILASVRKTRTLDLRHNFSRTLDEFQKADQRASQVYALVNAHYDPAWDYQGFPKP